MPYKDPLKRKQCARESAKRAYDKNPEKFRERSLKFHYDNFERMKELKAQRSRDWRVDNPEQVTKQSWKARGLPEPTRPRPEVCECCGKPPGARALALDHCHETGKFRGWLCGPCNVSIGGLGDNIDGISNAIAYLWSTNHDC